MIELRNVCKTYVTNGRHKVVANHITVVFPPRRAVAVLGRNGAGKSTLLRMISGAMDPDSGRVIRHGTVSWPVGFAGSFHADLTGLQNVRFIGRVYGVDTDELADFVADFAELGDHFNLPVRSYSSGMKSRLAFGVSMGIHFDTYLVDEVTAVGDASFKSKSELLFKQRLSESAAVMVTHTMGQVRRMCHHAGVLENGNFYFYEDVEEAIAHHERVMGSNDKGDE
ncbi:ABC transporter ATP-binding protein [Rhodobacter maris]|uniref:Capsular polysaccharide transport system ATP-binding protein n=1 Tax=Rhodobacter maris TaxID=446682 RepID=A0A285SEV3_9RHOB|nr:ABC transporter ATP-binding protein [Rhodobacter maris]SOC06452.1 capsular polysaccharide transport system ATP-binding protein [Rhodobacter maris]